MKLSHKFRTLVVAMILLAGLGGVIVRLFFLQVLWHDFFFEKASRQQRFSLTLPPKRGKILDRKGRDLAISVPIKSFYVVPSEIKDMAKTVTALAKIFSLNQKDIYKKIAKKKNFIWIKRKVDKGEASACLALKLKGVYFIEETKRIYPGGKLLSHVLGFTGLDDKGLEGLELQFNKYLKGKPGWKLSERDATGREVLTPLKFEVRPEDGFNLVLTIDAGIQTLVESQLDQVMEEFDAQSATAVVIEPQSGEILALANRPAYDLNEVSKYPSSVRRNRAITDFFEPGSTLKPVVVSAALQEKLVKLSDRFYCENGVFSIPGGHLLHDVHPYGVLSVEDIVVKSSNIGMAKIGCRLGAHQLYHYLKKFGFGNETGIDLPGEISGWLHPLSQWSKLTPYMVPMGQEITVTAVQLARAYCALANQGVLVRPHLIRQIVDTEGNSILQAKTQGKEQVLSQEAVNQIVQAMKGVVSEDGTGYNAQVEGYSVAGKTGTAQKVVEGGKYSHSKFVSSFVGFLPADHPQAVVLVVVNEPQHFHYGGTVAAPAFKEIAGDLMRYLEVPPDQMLAKKEKTE
ncbi:MAG: penicillin-binding protein 2, partial [Chlamydiae bacterium]|nr:penicillin-binding protein 2 [Chlamydiota bacterium]MBI3276897.1 penicillin-binding protein 2 [Chlamydiota bacterium]